MIEYKYKYTGQERRIIKSKSEEMVDKCIKKKG